IERRLGRGAWLTTAGGSVNSSSGARGTSHVSPDWPITASICRVAIALPSSARTVSRTPSAGHSIDMVALPVSISASSSPRLTSSPARLSRGSRVASVMDARTAGSVISTAMLYLSILQNAPHGIGDVRNLGNGSGLRHRRKRDRRCGRADSLHGRIEVVKGMVADQRCDLSGDACPRDLFGNYDGSMGFSDRTQDRSEEHTSEL